MSVGHPFRTLRGSTILLDGWGAANGIFASTQKEPLEDIASILSAAELTSTSTVERVFSPDEDLFQPYFQFLQIGYDDIIKDARIKPSLESAFDYFQKSDFTHCISSLGLIAEDYITQVYEYFLRASCGKGNTLGQIYDQLHSQLRDLTMPAPIQLGEPEPLYKAIKELEGLAKVEDGAYKRKLETTLRDLVSLVKADRRYYNFRIDSLSKPTRRVSVFPESIHENLMELIRNRNAASHKTRIPLGSFEALRTLYCLTAFVLWWHTTRSSTDWGKQMEQIVKDATAAAAG